MTIIRLGRPTPWRGIITSLVMGAGATVIGMLLALFSSHPENAPLLLLFLLLPAIVIPCLIALNQYAEFDPQTGLISVNGTAPVPLSRIDRARTRTFRGVSSIDLGTGPTRKERFMVANGPFGSPRVERDWVRHLLPYTGLPRRGQMLDAGIGTENLGSETLEDVQIFAQESLK
ncbi:hypothetical protein ACYX8G_07110 [Microbacterium saperdae]